MRTMVLEYESQHLPLSKITQSCRFAYTSTMVRIWDTVAFLGYPQAAQCWTIVAAAKLAYP